MNAPGITVDKYCPTCGEKFAAADNATRCSKDDSPLLPLTKDPFIGRLVEGRYELLEVVGSGASSMVYSARQTDLNRMMAFKLLRGDLVSSALKIQRFEMEARLIGRLNHSNICSVFDFGVLGSGQPYLVLELVEGKSLATILSEEHKLKIPRAVRLLKQIAAGLQEAHSNGVMHRDLKPGNIMVVSGEDGETVKIIDFGLARALDLDKEEQLTTSGYIFGTPSYMSPEQVLGKALDARTDIYSVGCIFYEMLTGKRAIDGATAFDIMSKHVQSGPDQLEVGMTPELQQIVSRCMQKEPAKRYQNMQELLDVLEGIQTSQGFAVSVPKYGGISRATIAMISIAAAGLIGLRVWLTSGTAGGDQSERMINDLTKLEASNDLDTMEASGKKVYDWLQSHGKAQSQQMIDLGHLMERLYKRHTQSGDMGQWIKAVFDAEQATAMEKHDESALSDAYKEAGMELLGASHEAEAVPYLTQWLGFVEKKYGADSTELKQPLNALARAEASVGMYKQAEENYNRLLELWKKDASQEGTDSAVATMRDISTLYSRTGDAKRAEDTADKAVLLATRSGPRIQEAVLERASVCAANAKHYEKAARLVNQAIESINKRTRSQNSEEGLQLLVMRGRYLREAGRYGEADDALKHAVKRISAYYTDGNLYKWAQEEYAKNSEEMEKHAGQR